MKPLVRLMSIPLSRFGRITLLAGLFGTFCLVLLLHAANFEVLHRAVSAPLTAANSDRKDEWWETGTGGEDRWRGTGTGIGGQNKIDGAIVRGTMISHYTRPGSDFRESHLEDWVAKHLPEWQSFVYAIDGDEHEGEIPEGMLRSPENRGAEATVYLTYIIDQYDDLPDTVFFLHDHKSDWHNPLGDNVWAVQNLRRSWLQRKGYVNLRCQPWPGCPIWLSPLASPDDMISDRPEFESAIGDQWSQIFNNSRVPSRIGANCCAQFAVTKWAIQQRPKEDYLHFRNWILNANRDKDSRYGGFMFEFLWHIVFGKDPVNCPPMEECLHEQYGMGKLGYEEEDAWPLLAGSNNII